MGISVGGIGAVTPISSISPVSSVNSAKSVNRLSIPTGDEALKKYFEQLEVPGEFRRILNDAVLLRAVMGTEHVNVPDPLEAYGQADDVDSVDGIKGIFGIRALSPLDIQYNAVRKSIAANKEYSDYMRKYSDQGVYSSDGNIHGFDATGLNLDLCM